jgi:uncharacterized membrane protein SpoIIM required for sporulation
MHSLQRWISESKPKWDQLQAYLDQLNDNQISFSNLSTNLEILKLYQKTISDLNYLKINSPQSQWVTHLDHLVAQAYSALHHTHSKNSKFNFIHYFFNEITRAFQRHRWAFFLSLLISLIAALMGATIIHHNEKNRIHLLSNFIHSSHQNPEERVKIELNNQKLESTNTHKNQALFAGSLFKQNIKVCFYAIAFGFTCGIFTLVILFYNMIVLGAITYDFFRYDQMRFLLSWLLPHGSVEIPAVILSATAGLMLGHALLGWADHHSLNHRLKLISKDITALIILIIILLIWAAIIEAYISLHHDPVIPYKIKIIFGTFQFLLLLIYLFRPLKPYSLNESTSSN